ncbi:MAG: ABC transporter permease, partial [Patescibacteria group bacterium]
MIKFVRNIKTAISSIGSYKFQSFLSTLGIMFGAMSLVAMLSIGLGSRVALVKQLESLGENVIIIIPGQMSGRTSFGSKQDSLKSDDVEAIEAIENIKSVSPGIASSFPVEYLGNKSKPEVTGVAPSFMEIRRWQLQEGRFIEDYDIDTLKKICVIGQTVARDLFFNISPTGKSLSIGGKDFEVVGLLEPKGFSMSGRDQD